jgi:hypothetical protein
MGLEYDSTYSINFNANIFIWVERCQIHPYHNVVDSIIWHSGLNYAAAWLRARTSRITFICRSNGVTVGTVARN